MATVGAKVLSIYAEVKQALNKTLILKVFIFLLGSFMTHSE